MCVCVKTKRGSLVSRGEGGGREGAGQRLRELHLCPSERFSRSRSRGRHWGNVNKAIVFSGMAAASAILDLHPSQSHCITVANVTHKLSVCLSVSLLSVSVSL